MAPPELPPRSWRRPFRRSAHKGGRTGSPSAAGPRCSARIPGRSGPDRGARAGARAGTYFLDGPGEQALQQPAEDHPILQRRLQKALRVRDGFFGRLQHPQGDEPRNGLLRGIHRCGPGGRRGGARAFTSERRPGPRPPPPPPPPPPRPWSGRRRRLARRGPAGPARPAPPCAPARCQALSQERLGNLRAPAAAPAAAPRPRPPSPNDITARRRKTRPSARPAPGPRRPAPCAASAPGRARGGGGGGERAGKGKGSGERVGREPGVPGVGGGRAPALTCPGPAARPAPLARTLGTLCLCFEFVSVEMMKYFPECSFYFCRFYFKVAGRG